MAKISELTATTGPLPSGSLIPVVESGVTKKIPIEELQKFIATSGTPFIITDGLGNDFEIIVSGGNLIIPTYVDLPSAQTITGRKKLVVPGESNSLRLQETDGSTGIDIYNDETGLRKTWLRQFDNNSSIALGRYLGGGIIETWNVLLALEAIRLWASRQVAFYDSGLVLSAGIGCTGAGVINLTNAYTAGGTFGAVAYTPSQITGTENNYASIHGRSLQVRLSSDAARTINGITAGVDGETHILRNVGSYNISFAHLSGSATGSQIYCDTSAQTDLQPGARALLEYDSTSGVWVLSKLPNNNLRVDASYPFTIRQVSGDVELFRVADGGQVTVNYTLLATGMICNTSLQLTENGSLIFYNNAGWYAANFCRTTGALGVLNLWDANAQTAGATFAFKPSSPSQITSNQTNYSLPGLSKNVRVSTDALRELQGIAAGTDGVEYTLILTGSNNLTIKHDSGSATGKRIYCHGSADITLAPNDILFLMFDATTDVWRAR